jgi:hypothetical protein
MLLSNSRRASNNPRQLSDINTENLGESREDADVWYAITLRPCVNGGSRRGKSTSLERICDVRVTVGSQRPLKRTVHNTKCIAE